MDRLALREELQRAKRGWRRACFGSIVSRFYDEIKQMTTNDRQKFIKKLGLTKSYMHELNKELKRIEYDKKHGYI